MTVSGDQYSWGSAVSGSWDEAANWDDTTAGLDPASVAPGSNDAVTIPAPSGGVVWVITGTGDSASLTLQGATVLSGTFETGTFALATTPNAWDSAGSLRLGAGSSLTVTGGASFAQYANLTLGGTRANLGADLTFHA